MDELKVKGMTLAAQAGRQYLIRARQIALEVGRLHGQCSIEDIRDRWPSMPSGMWCGSVFKDGNWTFHSFINSRHKIAHSRPISLWTYNPAVKKSEPSVSTPVRTVHPAAQLDLDLGMNTPYGII